MLPEVLDEKVLSCIIEMIVPLSQVTPVLDALEEAAQEIDTLFSIDLTARVGEDLSVPTEGIMREHGKWFSFNGKTNIGLGRLNVRGRTYEPHHAPARRRGELPPRLHRFFDDGQGN